MDNFIVYEDDCILVCNKPAGMPSQDDKTGDISLYSIMKARIKCEMLVMLQRLDRPVFGLVLFAKTNECASFFANKEKSMLEKIYCGIICGKPKNESGTLTNTLVKNERKNISSVIENHPKGKRAVLHYQVIETIKSEWCVLSKVMIKLETGRHHQIRVQFSHIGHGIFGDTKYNQNITRTSKIKELALYCKSVSFIHPRTLERKVFTINSPLVLPYNLFSKNSEQRVGILSFSDVPNDAN